MRQLYRSFLMLAVAAPLAAQGTQQGSASAAPAAVAPAVGDVAPDFTLPWADGKGTKSEPLTLSKLHGQVVVLAFYPADFSSGCTIEMTKFRDEYRTMFGDGVTVIPISHDSLSTHTRWVNDKTFPFSLASDTTGAVAKQYASFNATRPQYFSRSVYVIGKDGKIAWASQRFNASAQVGYDDLAAAVAAAKK
jgi:peroxiredoxin Q/BCP